MVFFGEYIVSFTSGGRLVLPKKMRELVSGSILVITKGFDNCLTGFSKNDWEERSKEFLSRSLLDTSDLSLKRVLFSGAVYVELDDQGRFVLPKNLLDFSQIKNKAVVVGVGDHFEIWSEIAWSEYLTKAEKKTKLN